MYTRFLSILFALLLVPALGMAQRGGFGGGHFGGGHGGFPGGGQGGFRGGGMPAAPAHIAPAPGIVSRPGAVVVTPGFRTGTVFVPGRVGSGISTGGLGFVSPFTAPSFRSGSRIVIGSNGAFFGRRVVFGSNGFFFGARQRFFPGRSLLFIGSPFGFPLFFDGFAYTTLDDLGYTAAAPPVVQQSPNVIVIEPNTYQYQPDAAARPPAKPLTQLAFKDHSIYAVTDYYTVGDRLWYTSSQGLTESSPIDQLDVPLTSRLNAERGVTFQLPRR